MFSYSCSVSWAIEFLSHKMNPLRAMDQGYSQLLIFEHPFLETWHYSTLFVTIFLLCLISTGFFLIIHLCLSYTNYKYRTEINLNSRYIKYNSCCIFLVISTYFIGMPGVNFWFFLLTWLFIFSPWFYSTLSGYFGQWQLYFKHTD